MIPRRYDSRHAGLDAYVLVAKTLADSPWLHMGMWEPDERVVIPNVRHAQERYVERLLRLFPPPPALVLDIGGGTGEMARLLSSKGYGTELITPSPLQAEEARRKLEPDDVHECFFEDFASERKYDVCLFSESFQYIPLEESLPRLRDLLEPGGVVIIADNFRRDDFDGHLAPCAGHRISQFLAGADRAGLDIVADEDVTDSVAPSMIIDQDFYRSFAAPLIDQISAMLKRSHPLVHGLVAGGYTLFTSKDYRYRMRERLKADYRSPDNFRAANTYRFLVLKPR